jgi:hypothetical protein
MKNRTTNILIFSTLVLVVGVISIVGYQGIKKDIEKNW